MRGHLRIKSTRTNYRRAGLAFGEDRVMEVSAIAIAAGQLVTLSQDPALRIDVWHLGEYTPLAPLLPPDGLDETTAGQLLRHLGADLEEEGEPAPAPIGGDTALALATAQEELRQARERISELSDELGEANREGDELAERLKARDARIEELEAERARLPAAPADPAAPGAEDAGGAGEGASLAPPASDPPATDSKDAKGDGATSEAAAGPKPAAKKKAEKA